MGSYDFGSQGVHFYSHNLWSSPWCALKTFLHVCLWPCCLWLINLLIRVVSFPEILFGCLETPVQPSGQSCLTVSGSGSHQSYTEPGTTGSDVSGVILHSLWTSQGKGAGPVKASLTALLITLTLKQCSPSPCFWITESRVTQEQKEWVTKVKLPYKSTWMFMVVNFHLQKDKAL